MPGVRSSTVVPSQDIALAQSILAEVDQLTGAGAIDEANTVPPPQAIQSPQLPLAVP